MTHARILAQMVRWLVAALALLAAAEVAAAVEVKGTVRDPEGNPAKGAKVFVIQTDAEGHEVLSASANADEKGVFAFANIEEKPHRRGIGFESASTGRDGTFRIEGCGRMETTAWWFPRPIKASARNMVYR